MSFMHSTYPMFIIISGNPIHIHGNRLTVVIVLGNRLRENVEGELSSLCSLSDYYVHNRLCSQPELAVCHINLWFSVNKLVYSVLVLCQFLWAVDVFGVNYS